jgi:hypothetical protein
MQAIKAPVELEWRLEKNQVEARVEHTLKLVAGAVRTQAEVGNERGLGNEWEVHATTRMHLTALFGVIPFVDLKLPTNNLRGIAVVGSAAPMLNFPGGVSWSGLWTASGPPMLGHADDVVIVDEKGNPLKVGPTDAVGRTRVFLKDAKQATLVLKSIYRALGPNRRMYVSLPRPLNTLERAGRVFVQADKHIELLTGPEGAEELAPERHQWEQISPQAPAAAEFAWRPHHHEITAQAELDIVLHDHSAEVSETLRFSREAIAGDLVPKLTLGTRTSAIVLHRPHGVDNVKLLSGGVLVSDDSERHTLRVHPDGGDDRVVLKFTFDVAIREGQLVMHALWPVRAAQNEAKVRLFAASGLQARLAPELAERGLWKERSIEIVPGKDQFPSLVLHGAGSSLPLTLNVKEITTASSAAFFAERALIQARVQENGGQHYRALYYLGKIHAQHVDIALPLPESRLRERPAIFLGGRMLTYDRVDADGKVIRV